MDRPATPERNGRWGDQIATAAGLSRGHVTPSGERTDIVIWVVIWLLAVVPVTALWVLTAGLARRGQPQAAVVSSIFFSFYTLIMVPVVYVFAGPAPGPGLTAVVCGPPMAGWLLGLVMR